MGCTLYIQNGGAHGFVLMVGFKHVIFFTVSIRLAINEKSLQINFSHSISLYFRSLLDENSTVTTKRYVDF